jgi:hypothetical protein
MRISSKQADRREQFRILGAAISAQGCEEIRHQAWRDRTSQHQFELRGRAVQDPSVSSRLFGPRMKTLQFERGCKVTK